MTFPYEVTFALLKDIKAQAPQAVCKEGAANESVGVLINRTKPPFDSDDVRDAIALTLDRQSFIDILGQGEGDIGGVLLPPPEGVWGMPTERLMTLPGYGGDAKQNREKARELMKKAGYGPEKHLTIKLSTRNIPVYRDPSAILLDQLKEIWIDGDLELVETANWVPKLIRKDFTIGLNVLGTAVDEPDVYFYQNYVSGSKRTILATTTRSSTSWSTSNRKKSIRSSARSWCRTPITYCKRVSGDRSSIMCARQPAGSRS
jgi:peptide/nickel transport system substrate-binding protein